MCLGILESAYDGSEGCKYSCIWLNVLAFFNWEVVVLFGFRKSHSGLFIRLNHHSCLIVWCFVERDCTGTVW